MNETTLTDLKPGDCAIVEEVTGCPETCQKLASVGLCCGAWVKMITSGSLCAVQVGESRLMLRPENGCAIKVCPLH